MMCFFILNRNYSVFFFLNTVTEDYYKFVYNPERKKTKITLKITRWYKKKIEYQIMILLFTYYLRNTSETFHQSVVWDTNPSIALR